MSSFGKRHHIRSIVLQAYISWLIAFYIDCLPYDNEYGPDYGTEWVMFLDDNGTTHVMNFSALPQRGLVFGEAYFYLYTRRNDIAEIIQIPENDNSTINSKYFNASNDLKIITHGWLSKEATGWLQDIRRSLLNHSDYNVINVDWSELADNPIYPWSAFSTRYVGKRIAKLLVALGKSYQVDGENVHLIGHSLGAQVMGYAGMFYHRYKAEQQVHRITGLDPARPLFELPRMRNDFRLEKTDARFVDIIHSCGGVLGYMESHGHADFYPNNGKPLQPGCEGIQKMIESCSHGRAIEFFHESINSNHGFMAYPCDSWEKYENGECKNNPTMMGLPTPTDSEGDFYLHTNSNPEYAEAQ